MIEYEQGILYALMLGVVNLLLLGMVYIIFKMEFNKRERKMMNNVKEYLQKEQEEKKE